MLLSLKDNLKEINETWEMQLIKDQVVIYTARTNTEEVAEISIYTKGARLTRLLSTEQLIEVIDNVFDLTFYKLTIESIKRYE